MKIILTENSPITTVEAALMGGNKMIVNRVGHSRITDVVAFMSPFAEVDIYRNCIVTLG